MKIKKVIIVLACITVVSIIALIFTKNKSEEIIKQKKEEQLIEYIEFDDDDYDLDIIVENDDEEIEESEQTEYDGDESIEFDEDSENNYIEEKHSDTPITIPPEEIETNKDHEAVVVINVGDNSTPIIPD